MKKYTSEQLITLVSKFIYEDPRTGIYRRGNYDLERGIFITALEEFLTNGSRVLDEYDKLHSFDWDIHHVFTKEEIEFYEKSLNQETYWNIYAIKSESDIEELKTKLIIDKAYYAVREEYSYKRHTGFTHQLKQQVIKRDNYQCLICTSPTTLEVDHIIPLFKGGSNDLINLQTLCKKCHGEKTRSERLTNK